MYGTSHKGSDDKTTGRVLGKVYKRFLNRVYDIEPKKKRMNVRHDMVEVEILRQL